MKTLTIHSLTTNELDKIVNKVWSQWHDQFSCVQVFGWSNETDHVVLDVKDQLSHLKTWDQYDRHRIDGLVDWTMGRVPHGDGLPSLLDSLCFYGVIPSGHYVIRVSW